MIKEADFPLNMHIDRELWRQASIKAAEQGITKRELVERALTLYLREDVNNNGSVGSEL